MTNDARENRLRRMAQRQGLALRKSKRRDPRARDYGMFWVIDPAYNTVVSPEAGMTLDEVETYLTK